MEDQIKPLAERNARAYLTPLSLGLRSAVAGGLLPGASTLDPLRVSLEIRAAGAFVPDHALEFEPILPEAVTYRGRTFTDPYVALGTTTPSVAGKGRGVRLVPSGDFRDVLLLSGENPDRYEFVFPAGLDIPALPFAAIQVGVGLPRNTDVIVRAMPAIEMKEEMGSISAFGMALRHRLDPWVSPTLPVHLAAGLGFQRLGLGRYADAEVKLVSLMGGRDLGPITVHAGAGVESSSITVTYQASNPRRRPGGPDHGLEIRFRDRGTEARVTGGFSLALLPLRLNVEASTGSYPRVSAGVGVEF